MTVNELREQASQLRKVAQDIEALPEPTQQKIAADVEQLDSQQVFNFLSFFGGEKSPNE